MHQIRDGTIVVPVKLFLKDYCTTHSNAGGPDGT